MSDVDDDMAPVAPGEGATAAGGDDATEADAKGKKKKKKGPALVFGASGAQGRAVLEGLLSSGYSPVYGATRHPDSSESRYARDVLGAEVLGVDLADAASVKRSLIDTAASSVFLVTTTDLPSTTESPTGVGDAEGYGAAEDREYGTIVSFFDALIAAHEEDGVERHVVFSALDNVKAISEELSDDDGRPWIEPLEDGSVAAHYSGKGRAGERAIELLRDAPGLSLTLLTLPFLHSNFLGFAAPLPDEGGTQWSISACFGMDSEVDMFSESDLAYIVPELFDEKTIYAGKNVRVSAERITMDEVAEAFADLFGRDVIYNPLTPREMSDLPIPAAGPMAQMCQFLGDPRSAHDVEATEAIMYPRKPRLFRDWLLIHSDSRAFEEVGLSVDPTPILSVTVFGATSLQGTSVVRGLLADGRKRYEVRATTRDASAPAAGAVRALDPGRVELVAADFDDVASCASAVGGSDGAFLAVDFFSGAAAGEEAEVWERRARNIVDACEASRTVRHVVFSTMEYVQEIGKIYSPGRGGGDDEGKEEKGGDGGGGAFDAKARAVAYARTKKLSCTFVLMPCYPEMFLHLLRPERRTDEETGEERRVLTIPLEDDTKVGCMSVDDLGPAVANIFDSYQVYAGHEIGLVTEFVTMKEASEIMSEGFASEAGGGGGGDEAEGGEAEDGGTKKEGAPAEEKWVEARGTYMKDLGQMFKYMSHTDAVRKRHSVARTMKLVPSAKPLSQWVEHNKDNAVFREKLGLR